MLLIEYKISAQAHLCIIVNRPHSQGNGPPEVWKPSLAVSRVLCCWAKPTNQDCLSYAEGDWDNVKQQINFEGGLPRIRLCTNLLCHDALLRGKAFDHLVDDRRAVIAGVRHGESQESWGEDEGLHGKKWSTVMTGMTGNGWGKLGFYRKILSASTCFLQLVS